MMPDGQSSGLEFGRAGVPRARPPSATPRGDDSRDHARSSLALANMRAVVILIVVAFHSALAYLGSQSATLAPFNDPAFMWRAFPIIDSHRWFGFDIFCAWQDVYLMALMFFLSALFTWPSVRRKGDGKFLADRFARLGVPFIFAIAVVVPIAEYPAWRVRTLDPAPGLVAYAHDLLALPFWPVGPMWFLWQLLALTILAAGLHRFAPAWIERLGRAAQMHPGGFIAGLMIAALVAYVPMALLFTPWRWSASGLFAVQFSRPLLYAVCYVAGLSVGANGFQRGLLAPGGLLARRWLVWLTLAVASFVAWLGLTALAMSSGQPPLAQFPLALHFVVDASFAVACVSGGWFLMAACLRFATQRWRTLDSLAGNAFAIYVIHYPFVVWLQYSLLHTALFAAAKFAIVLVGSLSLSWALIEAVRRVRFGPALIGEARATARPLLDANKLARS